MDTGRQPQNQTRQTRQVGALNQVFSRETSSICTLRARLRSISRKCHTIWTLSPLDAARPKRLFAPAKKNAKNVLATSQKNSACHVKRFSKISRTRLNVFPEARPCGYRVDGCGRLPLWTQRHPQREKGTFYAFLEKDCLFFFSSE